MVNKYLDSIPKTFHPDRIEDDNCIIIYNELSIDEINSNLSESLNNPWMPYIGGYFTLRRYYQGLEVINKKLALTIMNLMFNIKIKYNVCTAYCSNFKSNDKKITIITDNPTVLEAIEFAFLCFFNQKHYDENIETNVNNIIVKGDTFQDIFNPLRLGKILGIINKEGYMSIEILEKICKKKNGKNKNQHKKLAKLKR